MCGRPHSGVVADIMRKTRAAYHYAVRQVRRNENDIVKRFANAVLENNVRDFWCEVKKLTSVRSNFVNSVVDSVTGCDPIADYFANKYNELYSTVAYDVQDMDNLKRDVDNQLSQMQGRNDVCIIILVMWLLLLVVKAW